MRCAVAPRRIRRVNVKILEYGREHVACMPSDPVVPRLAREVGEALVAACAARGLAGTRVEHFGSTAVPGLAGKGVIDLLLLYPDGGLARARRALADMGFQRQRSREPWPEERPMRVGAVESNGRSYRLHVHVVQSGAAEVARVLAFRDRLRADAALRRAYEDLKRDLVDRGVADPLAYSHAKSPFIEQARGS
jgi:GrpB-like predicted nucleotidyltransferase (UPF0157 family)